MFLTLRSALGRFGFRCVSESESRSERLIRPIVAFCFCYPKTEAYSTVFFYCGSRRCIEGVLVSRTVKLETGQMPGYFSRVPDLRVLWIIGISSWSC